MLRNPEYARVGRRRAARALLSVLRHGGGPQPRVAVLPAFLMELRRDPRRTRLLFQVNISGMESLGSVRLECLSSVVFFTFSSPLFFSPNSEEAKSTTWLHPVTGEAVITGHRKTPGKRFLTGEKKIRMRRNAVNAAAEPQLWQNATRAVSLRSRSCCVALRCVALHCMHAAHLRSRF